MSFRNLGLRAELLRAIDSQGYTEPTPVQAEAIPVVLDQRDVMAGAQTGTGKTAAFALPVLQLLADGGRCRTPRVLVLAPTRELAAQVGESFEIYGNHLPLRTTVVFGGVGIQPQIDQLRRGVDILVATPGRLLDHAGRKTVDLSGVEILILDEADRMLDMGFIHDIRKVLRLLPRDRQNLFFSATYPDSVQELADSMLDRPARIDVAPRNTAAESVTQIVHHVERTQKRALLSHLIQEGDWSQVLVFTRTKHGANRLAKQLVSDGIEAEAIHGNKSQSARTRALTGFKSGRVRALIATDIASRGIDIDQLPHVVNFDLPNVPEDYVHRIGRTGRAGSEGTARSLVSAEEKDFLRGIERLLRTQIPVEDVVFPRRASEASRPQSASSNYSRRQGTRTRQPRQEQSSSHQPKQQDGSQRRRKPQESSSAKSEASTDRPQRRRRRRKRPAGEGREQSPRPETSAKPAVASTPARQEEAPKKPAKRRFWPFGRSKANSEE